MAEPADAADGGEPSRCDLGVEFAIGLLAAADRGVGHPAFLRLRSFPGVDARENFRAPGDFPGAVVFRDAPREASECLRGLIHAIVLTWPGAP